MKSFSERLEYQKLERVPSSQAAPSLQNSSPSILAQIRQAIIRYCTAVPELRVWQSRTFMNRTVWNAYDPVTGDFVSMGSEAEMRQWIEQRYSR